MKKTLALVFVAAVALGFFAVVGAQTPGPPKTYTCSWNHDGVGVDSFAVLVDGAVATTTIACSGSGPERLCSTPLTMTTNVSHVVLVKAVNAFGEAAAPPFPAAPPKPPAGVGVK